MRHFLTAATLILAAVTGPMLAAGPGHAQDKSQLPQPPAGFKPPPAAPVKPYTAVPIKPPTANTDAGFVAFRKQLADIAEHKDRAALTKLVVAQGFFWTQEKDMADKRKPGIANLAKAIDLDAKDGTGWDLLSAYAADQTTEALQDHQGVICGPAEPDVDSKAFEALLASTKTEPSDWGYPSKEGIDVLSAAKPNAPAVEKLGLTLVRVLPEAGGPDDAASQPPPFLHIALPSGKSGYVPVEAIASLGADQMCYIKDASGWKITGYFGGASE
jgi:hypothetical protein